VQVSTDSACCPRKPHAKEISKLIVSYGGRPVVAPSMREVKLESNSQALEFASGLMQGLFDMVIFLTGTGIRGLVGPSKTCTHALIFGPRLGECK